MQRPTRQKCQDNKRKLYLHGRWLHCLSRGFAVQGKARLSLRLVTTLIAPSYLGTRGGGIRGAYVRDIIAPGAMALTPGTKLGLYEIQSPLGAGGMVSTPFYGVSPDGKKLLLARVAQRVSQSVRVVTKFAAGGKEEARPTFGPPN